MDPAVGGPFVGMDISHRLHVTSGSIDRSVTLPELPGAGDHHVPMLDRVGEQLHSKWPLVAAGGIGGGVIGSKLLRHGGGGIFRGILGGIAGVLAGSAITLGASALLAGGRAHRAKPAPDGAHEPSTDVATPEHVKVMTFNIHGGMGGPNEFGSSEEEMDRLAEAIRREQPDVVMLQEVDDFAVRSNMSDNLAELDERLDPTSTVGAGASTSILGREQHVALMTFNGFRITDARNIVHQDPRGGGLPTRFGDAMNQAKGAVDHVLDTEWSDKDPDLKYQARNTIEAMVRTPGGTDMRVLTGHYEWPNARFDHQELQIGEVSRAISSWKGPTIWGADFNVKDASADGDDERRMMARAGLRDTLRGESEQGGIDRIYASDHAKVVDSRVVLEAGDVSDHMPVVAELQLSSSGR